MYQRRYGLYDEKNVWHPGWDDGGMMTLQENHVAFLKMFDYVDQVIEPNAAWVNGYGIPVHAVNPERRPGNVKLLPGNKAKCTLTDRRRIIFIGTEMGVLAVFEMRPAGSLQNRILYTAAPDLMETGLIKMSDMDNPFRLESYILGTPGNPPALFREVGLFVKLKKAKEHTKKFA